MTSIPPSGLLAVVDKLVETRHAGAAAAVRRVRSRNPGAGVEEVTKALIHRTGLDIARVAAVSGSATASPGVGTSAAVVATGADLAYTVARLGEMIMAIGIAHGHETSTPEQRREWVLSVLGGPGASTMSAEALVAEVEALRRVRSVGVEQINTRVGARLATKLATRSGTAARIGRLLPLGIGAGVGAAANWMAARNVGKAAATYFSGLSNTTTGPADATTNSRGDDILDLDGEELDPVTGRPL